MSCINILVVLVSGIYIYIYMCVCVVIMILTFNIIIGLIAINPSDQSPKIKIYRETTTTTTSSSGSGGLAVCKGDASLCYFAECSVSLALDILSGGSIRSGYVINVSRSEGGSGSGSSNTNTNPITNTTTTTATLTTEEKITRKAKSRVAYQAMQNAVTWAADEDEGNGRYNKSKDSLRIVIIEGMCVYVCVCMCV